MDEILRAEGISRIFEDGGLLGPKRIVRAVDDVSFSVYKGEVFVLAGESGSGKSTLANLILNPAEADSGKVFFGGRAVDGASDLKKVRMSCQMVHQDPYDSVNPGMKVADIVAEPLEIHGEGDKSYRKKRVLEALSEVRLEPPAEIAAKHPHMLSGGQRQRVALARALALKPGIIIADEPVSMLDVSIRAEMLELMSGLRKSHGITFLYITHDLATARHFGDRIAVMYSGKIVEEGPVDTVLLRPAHPYTQALIDAISEPDPGNLHREKIIRINDPPNDLRGGCSFRSRCPYAIDRCAEEPELEDAGGGRRVACFARLE
ncbi:ABC-type oligopeptide transport system, ATPase component [Cenarchaeum symbiosum A]|uniref:ABC-type oligopeptide transport system, ATPase component n=1 Tax=Cenarchaeum symbiosum (strain A) TaxID=414004 RepID=A0RUJ6_CENSY|nr:ABC-type oligopeptide transport system, ATPase component [Cenarchaeum symbiosum A]